MNGLVEILARFSFAESLAACSHSEKKGTSMAKIQNVSPNLVAFEVNTGATVKTVTISPYASVEISEQEYQLSKDEIFQYVSQGKIAVTGVLGPQSVTAGTGYTAIDADWVNPDPTNYQSAIDALVKRVGVEESKSAGFTTSISGLNSSMSGIVSSLGGAVSALDASVGQISSTVNGLGFMSEYHVAKNGDDATGTGSISKPYATISAAISAASAAYPAVSNNTPKVIIYVHPGRYNENVNLNRPNTSLVGVTLGDSDSVWIGGTVTCAPSVSSDGLYNSITCIERMIITPTNGSDGLVINPSAPNSFWVRHVRVWLGSSSNTACKVQGGRVRLYDSVFTTESGSGPALSLASGVNAEVGDCKLYAGTGPAIDTGATVIADSLIASGSGNTVFNVSSGALTASHISLQNYTSNKDGITIASGAQVTLVQSFFNVAGSTGFAVKGVLGAAYIHSYNSFVPGTSNRVSSAMGPGVVGLTTAHTLA